MHIIQQAKQFGLNDNNNKLLIPCIYESLSPILPTLKPRTVDMYEQIGKNEYVCAKKSGYFGAITVENELILPFEYDEIRRYAVADLFVVCKNKKWGAVNRSNQIMLPFDYDDLGNYFVGEGIIAKKGDFYGIIRPDTSEIVPFIYDNLTYGDPADGALRYPHWLLYDATYQGRKYTFGYNYQPLDVSIYGQPQQLTANFIDKNRCEYTLAVVAGHLPFGKIIVKSDGEEWEQVEYSKYRIISPENSYKYALAQLCEALRQNKVITTAYLKTLFAKVYTWSYLFWEAVSPLVTPQNLHAVAELMLIGLKKTASKGDIACGKKTFYEQGLRILKQHSSVVEYENHCNYLLAAVAKTPTKHSFLLDCFF